jgi:hypothetical protein
MRFCFDPLKESFKINLIVTLEALWNKQKLKIV